MNRTKTALLLCALTVSGWAIASAAPVSESTPLDPYRAAVQKMKDLDRAEKQAGEKETVETAPSSQPAAEVNYTDALMKGLDLTLPQVQEAVTSGTFRNLSPEPPAPKPEPVFEPEPEIPEEAPEPEPEEEPAPEPSQGKYTAQQGEAANILDTDGTFDNGSYVSEKADENALRVPMTYVSASDLIITKSGDTSSVESSALYGMNAALLVSHGGRGTFTRAAVTTKGLGSAAAYGYSKGTYVNLTDSALSTAGDNSPLLDLTGGALMKTKNTTGISTGNGSAAIRIGEGGGIIIAEGGSFITSGTGSHGVYSAGNVTLEDTAVTAQNTKAAVIKGNNTLTVTRSTLEGNESTDKIPYNIVMFSDESAIGTMGTQQFESNGSTLISHKGGMFYATGTHGKITFKSTNIIMDDPSAVLLTVTGNDGTNGWGTPGMNGGHIEVVVDGDSLDGNIVVDTISNINLTIKNNATYTGAITIIPNAEGGEAYKTNADVFIASGSTWNLTGDSSLTTLYNLGTINYNGHTITLADGTVLQGNE